MARSAKTLSPITRIDVVNLSQGFGSVELSVTWISAMEGGCLVSKSRTSFQEVKKNSLFDLRVIPEEYICSGCYRSRRRLINFLRRKHPSRVGINFLEDAKNINLFLLRFFPELMQRIGCYQTHLVDCQEFTQFR
jgi:hypothetical protein